jgi:UDP-GlcNAc:undecaprenyl-phosphate GlcNAc-1-phosphate transferase
MLWGAFLVALVLALVLTPFSIWIAPKVGAIDIPKDDRRMHVKPIPRFGGLAIFVAIISRDVVVWI